MQFSLQQFIVGNESLSSAFSAGSLYLLRHVGLGQVVENESYLFLHILWRLHNSFSLIRCHQQSVYVCGVD